MASDDDYMAFLNKANQDTGDNGASAQSASEGRVTLKARDKDVEVPPQIRAACKGAVYETESDEPFEEVALRFDDGLPDEEQFAKLINHPSPKDADISITDPTDWDPRGQYKDLVDAVREATGGNDVRVYSVQREGARVEYWVLSAEGGRIVGVKALAIQS